jgi:hypothetical protein
MRFADLTLSRQLEQAEGLASAAFVEARRTVAPESGARWTRIGGAYAMFDGPASPITQTFGLGLFEDATPEALAAIESFFDARAAPTDHEVSPIQGEALLPLLVGRGYAPIEYTTLLYRELGHGELQPDLNINPRILITRPASPVDHERWNQASLRGWSHVPGIEPFLRDMHRVNAARKDTVPFLAELEGQPIASAALCIHNRVGLLAGASTVPEARRQGAQLALLDARLKHAADAGCELVMMGAAPGSSSQRNAERHGFRIAYTRTKWRRPCNGRAPSPIAAPASS